MQRVNRVRVVTPQQATSTSVSPSLKEELQKHYRKSGREEADIGVL